jgi:hypothetical protein
LTSSKQRCQERQFAQAAEEGRALVTGSGNHERRILPLRAVGARAPMRQRSPLRSTGSVPEARVFRTGDEIMASTEPATPSLQALLDAFNTHDVDAIMSFFTEAAMPELGHNGRLHLRTRYSALRRRGRRSPVPLSAHPSQILVVDLQGRVLDRERVRAGAQNRDRVAKRHDLARHAPLRIAERDELAVIEPVRCGVFACDWIRATQIGRR